MKVKTKRALAAVIGCWMSGFAANGQSLPNLFPFPNATGVLETYNTTKQPIDLSGPFFQCPGNQRPKLRDLTSPACARLGTFGAGSAAPF